jgi:hypothetical protein
VIKIQADADSTQSPAKKMGHLACNHTSPISDLDCLHAADHSLICDFIRENTQSLLLMAILALLVLRNGSSDTEYCSSRSVFSRNKLLFQKPWPPLLRRSR